MREIAPVIIATILERFILVVGKGMGNGESGIGKGIENGQYNTYKISN
jgi:hypothetical protein